MALTDMKVGNSASPMDFDPGLSHYACGDFEGTVSVRRVGNGAEVCRLPAPGPGEVYPQFGPDGYLLAVVHPGLAQNPSLETQGSRNFRNAAGSEAGQSPR